jgi:transketolase
VIIADTVKGKGVKRMELDVNWHVGNLSPEDYEEVYEELLAGGSR